MTTMYDGRDLTEQSLDGLTLGAELGHVARAFLVKSTKSILGAATVIHKAYDLYYAPRAKRGQPKKHRPGSVLGPFREPVATAEEQEQERQWNAFLEASGFNMAQHQKLLRQYWRIGKRIYWLEKYSENLPNSLDALDALCQDDVKPDEFRMVLEEVKQQMTAAEIRKLIDQSRNLPYNPEQQPPIPAFVANAESANDLDNAGYQLSRQEADQAEAALAIKQRLFKEAIQNQKTESVFLLSMPPVEVTHQNMVEAALAMLVLKTLGFYKLSSELELEGGPQLTKLIELIPKQTFWKSSIVYGLDKAKRQSEYALKAMKLAAEKAMIEKEAA
jgi:hypothetical protein